ncbi:hypothetical protein ACPA9J_35010 [Pseudomonas aeruginosa]
MKPKARESACEPYPACRCRSASQHQLQGRTGSGARLVLRRLALFPCLGHDALVAARCS